jgi:hypothetical protein
MGPRRRGRADLILLEEYCLIVGRETRLVDAALPCADTTAISPPLPVSMLTTTEPACGSSHHGSDNRRFCAAPTLRIQNIKNNPMQSKRAVVRNDGIAYFARTFSRR